MVLHYVYNIIMLITTPDNSPYHLCDIQRVITHKAEIQLHMTVLWLEKKQLCAMNQKISMCLQMLFRFQVLTDNTNKLHFVCDSAEHLFVLYTKIFSVLYS